MVGINVPETFFLIVTLTQPSLNFLGRDNSHKQHKQIKFIKKP